MDVTELSTGDSERLVSDMREALADPIFAETMPPLADLRLTASNAPALARAFIALHHSYRQTHERLASLDEALGREDARVQTSPWEEVSMKHDPVGHHPSRFRYVLVIDDHPLYCDALASSLRLRSCP